MNTTTEVRQFSVNQILLYHLLPGIPILLLATFFVSPTFGLGLPKIIAYMLAIMIGLIPVQLTIIGLTARREGKKIKDIIAFTQKMPISKTILLALPLFIYAILIFVIVGPIEHPIWTIFNWVPDWFRLDRFKLQDNTKMALWISLGLNFIFNGLLGPFTEELYFRGFLLPRMKCLGKFAPLTNAALFSLYHFFSPWENITRILAITPYICAVWYKKNIRIGMMVHMTLNTFSCVGMLVSIINL